jgi:hypothetical protein
VTQHEWYAELVLCRIRDLNDAKMKAFTTADGIFHGSPDRVRELIGLARQRHADGNIAAADRACCAAELAILAERLHD